MLTSNPLDRERQSLRLEDESLGEGGQGTVTRVSGTDRLVYKEYMQQAGTPHAHALTDLVVFGTSLPAANRQTLFEQCAWPIARVFEGSAVTGFLMHEVPPEFYGPIGGRRRLVELQYLLYKPNHTWNQLHQPDVIGRLEIASKAVRLFALLHSHRFVLGDVSFRNLLWTPTRPYRVFMLDCDGVRRHGGEPVLPQAQTPEWDDPHQPSTGPDLDTDRYKIALLVGRVLTRDAYVRPGQNLDLMSDIDPQIAAAVIQLFGRAAGPHGSRPTAGEWMQALSGRKWIAVSRPAIRQPEPVDEAVLVTTTEQRKYRPVRIPGRQAVPSSGLGELVVASDAFAAQRQLAPCRLSDEQIARLIELLEQAGGRSPVTLISKPLNELPDRMSMILSGVCTLLNRDEEQILQLKDGDQTLELNLPLLREQFLDEETL